MPLIHDTKIPALLILCALPLSALHGQDSGLQTDFGFGPPVQLKDEPSSLANILRAEPEFRFLTPDQILQRLRQAQGRALWMDAIPTTHWKRTDIVKIGYAIYAPPTPCAHVVSSACSDLRKSQVSDTRSEAYHLVLGYMLGRYPCRVSSDSLTPCERELVDDFMAVAQEEQ